MLKKENVSLWLFVLAFTMVPDISSEELGPDYKPKPVELAEFKQLQNFEPALFDKKSVNIDNEWMPLKPGTQFIYKGYTIEEEGEKEEHTIIFTVTDLIKEIAGVDVVVTWDRDYVNDFLEETELTFFAQDKEGNVWHLGQYREVNDESELVGGRIWVQGEPEGSIAGIMMHKSNNTDDPSYSQGYAPEPFNWTDRARVIRTGITNTVAAGTFENVVVTEEYNAEEPEAFQLKYYAKGVGNIRIGWAGEDPKQETMELVELKTLTPEEIGEVRAEALKLESRGYGYSATKPARQR